MNARMDSLAAAATVKLAVAMQRLRPHVVGHQSAAFSRNPAREPVATPNADSA